MNSEYSKTQIKEAMQWVLLHEEEMTEQQARAFERWKKEHPNNEKCFFEHQISWSSLDSMRFWKPGSSKQPNPDLFVSGEPNVLNRYWVPVLAIAACITVGFLMLFHFEQPERLNNKSPMVAVETYESGKKHFLSDGSSLYLKKGSQLEVSFTESTRNLYLRSGEAIFEVAHDADRPFIVSTEHAQVVAVGTVFSVNSSPSFCEVYVAEGRVKLNEGDVKTRDHSKPKNLVPELNAGEMVNVPVHSGAFQPQIHFFSQEEYDVKTSWRHQIIEMVSAPLSEIIQGFNQYNDVHIYIPDPALREIRMSVTVNPDNQEEFLQLLEMTMNVEVKKTTSAIYIQAKH